MATNFKNFLFNNDSSFHSSWDEISLRDNTAMIDYILIKTNSKKLFHVCHSEGCAELYIMVTLKPEYNDKISQSVNLAPAVLFGHPALLYRIIATFTYQFSVS